MSKDICPENSESTHTCGVPAIQRLGVSSVAVVAEPRQSRTFWAKRGTVAAKKRYSASIVKGVTRRVLQSGHHLCFFEAQKPRQSEVYWPKKSIVLLSWSKRGRVPPK